VLYRNEGDANFSDVTYQVGFGEVTLPFLGWGTSFIDFDNDGWQDLFVVNGHVYPGVDQHQWGTSYAQQPLLFRNLSGKFERVGAAPGSGLAEAWPGRGLATGDLDGDGRTDLVMNNLDSKPAVLRNVSAPTGHWIDIRLVGDVSKKTPRDAVGSTVYLTAGRLRQRQDVVSGAGFCSQNDMTLHFGLGKANRVSKLEVRWANGTIENVNVPVTATDRVLVLTQGQGLKQDLKR
jgi:hypothetical protein